MATAKRTSKDKRKPIKFNGWDWTELEQLKLIAKQWPKTPKDIQERGLLSMEDAQSAYCICEYLDNLRFVENRKAERKQVAIYIRKFCLALSKCKTDYSSPVYAAMAKIEDDDTLFIWVRRNLEAMWN